MDSVIVKEITKTFNIKKNNKSKKFVVLDNVSFSAKEGEMVGIIGRNGSGKTTLLRIIAGIYPYDSGSVTVRGKISPLLQIGTGFQGELDAYENIVINGLFLNLSKSEIVEKIPKILEFAELQEFSKLKLKNYSSGMRTRLAFSIALNIDPEILLVDELLSVGDLTFRKKSFDAFMSLKEKSKTILFTSHNLGIVEKLCDKAILLDKGKIISEGKPSSVISHYEKLFEIDKKKDL